LTPHTHPSHLYVTIIIACIINLGVSGVLFGWPALLLILQKEGVYRERCDEPADAPDAFCSAQDLRLNLVFTMGVVSTMVFSPVTGAILDRWGPRRTAAGGSVLFALGCLLFAESGWLPFDSLPLSSICLSVGGPAFYLSSMHLSRLSPPHSATIVTLFSACFDSSSLVFLLFEVVNSSLGTTSQVLFRWLCLLPALAIAFTVVWPAGADDEAKGGDEREGSVEEVVDDRDEDGEGAVVVLPLEERKLSSQIWSREFGFLIVYGWICVMWSNFFAGTAEMRIRFTEAQYSSPPLPSLDAASLTRMLSIIMPSSVVFAPMFGRLIDRKGVPLSLSVTHGLGVAFSLLLALPPLLGPALFIPAFVLYSLYRLTYFAVFLSLVIRLFSFRHFGVVYGTLGVIHGGLTSLSYLFSFLVINTWDQSFNPVNVIQIVSMVLVSYIVFWVWRRLGGIAAGQKGADEGRDEKEKVEVGGDEAARQLHRRRSNSSRRRRGRRRRSVASRTH